MLARSADDKPSLDPFQNFTHHEISLERLQLMTSTFCAFWAKRHISLRMTNCPPSGRGQGHTGVLKCQKISVIISKTVQGRDKLTMED